MSAQGQSWFQVRATGEVAATNAEARPEPSGLEVAVTVGLALVLHILFVCRAANFWEVAFRSNDNQAYLHIAAIIRTWHPPGTVFPAFFWGFPYAIAGVSTVLSLPPLAALVLVSIVSSLAVSILVCRLYGGWVAVALYSFNYEVTVQHYFTHNYKSLEARLKTLHGDAGTALYDAIYLSARDLEARQGRKVMVIITDGGDTASSKDVHAALEAAQLADAVIYPVVVMPITNDAGRNIGGEHALQFMAEGTGGRPFLPSVGAQLDKAFADIITELRTQYLLAFYPHDVPLTKEPFHKLEVRVNRPELRVSARNGYYGEVEGGTGTSGARTSVVPDGEKKRQKK